MLNHLTGFDLAIAEVYGVLYGAVVLVVVIGWACAVRRERRMRLTEAEERRRLAALAVMDQEWQ